MKKIIAAGSFLLLRLNSTLKLAPAAYSIWLADVLSEIDHFLAARGVDGQIDLAVQLSRSANPSFQDDIRLVVWFH